MIEPGEVLAGRYRVVRMIGHGGMAAVYEAVHDLLGRRVAIKALYERLGGTAELLRRFDREARLSASIRHPNVVEIIDVGNHAGQPFIVFELLEGESLADRIEREGPLPVAQAARILTELLAGLQATHRAGVLHRDLKPDNVFLARCADGIERAKLVDFGISKRFVDKGEGAERLTKTGLVVGTPHFMSPEQARGDDNVDPRSDLYAAGVVLYQIVTLGLPFTARSDTAVLTRVAYEPQYLVAPRVMRPDLPFSFEELVLRALSHDRTKRFQSAAEFSAALEPWTSFDESRAAQPRAQKVSPQRRVQGRRPILAALGAATVLVGAAFGVVARKFTQGADPPPVVAEPARERVASRNVAAAPTGPPRPTVEVVAAAPARDPSQEPCSATSRARTGGGPPSRRCRSQGPRATQLQDLDRLAKPNPHPP